MKQKSPAKAGEDGQAIRNGTVSHLLPRECGEPTSSGRPDLIGLTCLLVSQV